MAVVVALAACAAAVYAVVAWFRVEADLTSARARIHHLERIEEAHLRLNAELREEVERERALARRRARAADKNGVSA